MVGGLLCCGFGGWCLLEGCVCLCWVLAAVFWVLVWMWFSSCLWWTGLIVRLSVFCVLLLNLWCELFGNLDCSGGFVRCLMIVTCVFDFWCGLVWVWCACFLFWFGFSIWVLVCVGVCCFGVWFGMFGFWSGLMVVCGLLIGCVSWSLCLAVWVVLFVQDLDLLDLLFLGFTGFWFVRLCVLVVIWCLCWYKVDFLWNLAFVSVFV